MRGLGWVLLYVSYLYIYIYIYIKVTDEKQYINRKKPKVFYLICPSCNQKSSPGMS